MSTQNSGLNKMSIKHIRKWVFIIFSIIAVPATTFFLIFYSTIPIHNLHIWRMERALDALIRENPDTTIVERQNFFGTIYTDTSECIYATGAFLSTNQSPREIIATYGDRSMSFFGFDKVPIGIYIEGVTAKRPPLDNPADDWITDLIKRYRTSTVGTHYLLYLYSPGHTFLGDYRCVE